jgi:hypothetical protein
MENKNDALFGRLEGECSPAVLLSISGRSGNLFSSVKNIKICSKVRLLNGKCYAIEVG